MPKKLINYKKASYYISKSIERVDYILKFNQWMKEKKMCKKEEYFYTNILLYESCLCKFCNIWECLCNQAYKTSEKNKNKREIILLFSQLDTSNIQLFEHQLLHKIFLKILSYVEYNPFFLWNLQFIWIKHEYKYFDKIEQRWNYDYIHYCFIREILNRCVFSKREKINNFFNEIKVILNWSNQDLYSFCRKVISYYGDNLHWYFGLVYDNDFRDYWETNEIKKLKRIRMFLRKIFMIIASDKQLIENNLYNLWTLAFENRKNKRWKKIDKK